VADIAIVGGGPVGLFSALLLARSGHQVVLLDSDKDPTSYGADEIFLGWRRPGVPQSLHGHVFRGRVGRVLREEAPDVLDMLLESGVEKAGYDFGTGFEQDVSPMSRRPVFEAVLRRIVRDEPSIEFRTGVRVAGLESADRIGVPRVVGLWTRWGNYIGADLVIDCGGRRSISPRWLDAIGSRLAVDHYQSCDLYYFARHYRLKPGSHFPSTTFPDVDLTPYGIFLAMGEDNGTFCLAGGLSKTDPYRTALRSGTTFERVMAGLPSIAPWLEAGTPITDVQLMGGIANRRRSLMDGDDPVVEGYILLGDASLYTNATLGQGVALGFWQAQALAHRADMIGWDNFQLVRQLETWTDQTLGPHYARQVRIDEAMVQSLRAGVAGAPMNSPRDEMAALMALRAQGDKEAAAAFHRIDNLLTDPSEEFADEELSKRVKKFLRDVPEGSTGPGPLPRANFEALLRTRLPGERMMSSWAHPAMTMREAESERRTSNGQGRGRGPMTPASIPGGDRTPSKAPAARTAEVRDVTPSLR
jgi:2-polyprenyl-6-methoxyphenol hydroxylase-like FAD-dependent oxidoreductase